MQKAPHALLPNVLFLFSIQGFPYFDSNSHFSLIFIILLKTCQTKFSFWLKASSQGTANLHKRGENLSIDRSIDRYGSLCCFYSQTTYIQYYLRETIFLYIEKCIEIVLPISLSKVLILFKYFMLSEKFILESSSDLFLSIHTCI